MRFKKSTRQITFECWPRHVDVTKPDAKQFTGWPITIRQEDNYARKPMAWLPTLEITGAEDPVVQIINEANDEIVYTLRIKGRRFRAKVFQAGTYTIKVGEGSRQKVINNVASTDEKNTTTLKVNL